MRTYVMGYVIHVMTMSDSEIKIHTLTAPFLTVPTLGV